MGGWAVKGGIDGWSLMLRCPKEVVACVGASLAITLTRMGARLLT